MLTPEYYYDVRRKTPSDIYQHLEFMHDAACSYEAPVVIELGVRRGNSTSAWLAAVEKAGAGRVISVDVDEPAVPSSWRHLPYWTLIVGDDQSSDVWDRVCVDLMTASFQGTADILFIDTSHEYQHTLSELDLYVPLLQKSGIVFLHDTEYWPDNSVMRAMQDYCEKHDLTWENRTGCCGLGIVKMGD